MYTRKLGKTGIEVSEIGFGAYVSASVRPLLSGDDLKIIEQINLATS
ncbi:hypothetical protein [Paenibacillus glycanilyticus]|uniref:Aldo/keto reductase n=1 Tax=Paenibacillus glycanilyticus TaxID=126569 RepID=A0ABQ6NQZ0_9BACL|nr:hypothetical protein [Paenibacillus glycanilyticus]GMK46973.1 hypothetical protein PghCCS26_41020 [Paenibacillus glycanilyticus]